MLIFKSNTLAYLILCLAFAIINYLSSTLISDDLYYNSLGEQFTYAKIDEILDQKDKWAWIGYVLIPVIYLIKFTLITFCLNVGILLSGYKVSFKKLFQITMYAEAIFLLPAIIKLLWFAFIQTDYTLEELQYFYPLSMLNLFEVGKLEAWWVYSFQVINVFEFGYLLLLAYGIGKQLDKSLNDALGFVLSTYGVGLLLWVVFITFLVVNLG